jgi:hypothetical protein
MNTISVKVHKDEFEALVPRRILPCFQCYQLTGSYVISPDPYGYADIDIIALYYEGKDKEVEEGLTLCGWERGGYREDTNSFMSFKGFCNFRGIQNVMINLILISDPQYYTRYAAATALAKQMELKKRRDRVSVFKVVLGETE